jgi:hypothetical protein
MDRDRVWSAALEVLRGTPLTSVDKASGTIITDWQRGLSDHRYFGTPDRPRKWLDIRFKATVSVRPSARGTWVVVDLFEETDYPRTVHYRAGWGAPRFPAFPRGFGGEPSPFLDADRFESFEVDDWVPTPSSTLKEKALLDRIESLASRR